jgi:DNA-binding CsgD family transcriptional regulator
MPITKPIPGKKYGPKQSGAGPSHFAKKKEFKIEEFGETKRSAHAGKSYAEQHLVEARPFTDSQIAVIEAVSRGETPYAAAKIAGVNPPYVYGLLNRPYVKAEIAARTAAFAKANDMTRVKVLEGLKEAIDMAKLMAEPSTMVQGWKTIGQMCGYFAPTEHRVKVDISGSVTMQTLNKLSDAELLEMIEKGAERDRAPLLIDQTSLGDEN